MKHISLNCWARSFAADGAALKLCILAFAAIACPAEAQSTADLDRQAIEIIGKAPSEIRHEAEGYVRDLGVASGDRPAGRWIDPICPKVIGLYEKQTVEVETQVRNIARSVGAPLAKQKCSGNLLVVFTDNANAVVAQVFRKQRQSKSSEQLRKKLEETNQPIRWWYSDAVRTRDDMNTGVLSPAFRTETTKEITGTTLAGSVPTNEDTEIINQPGSSLVSSQIKRSITSATIIVDVRRIGSVSLESISDYAAFVGLAEVKFGAAPKYSILNLFSEEMPLSQLSVSDQAFLTGLYKMKLDRKSDMHRRFLISEIIRKRTTPQN